MNAPYCCQRCFFMRFQHSHHRRRFLSRRLLLNKETSASHNSTPLHPRRPETMQASIAFTLVTLTGCIITSLTALTLIIILVRHLRRDRDVGLLLILNTYVIMFVFTVVLLSTTTNVLRADLYGTAILDDLSTTGCHLQGFLLAETSGCCYMSFVLQALYRLIRVVYAKHKYLQVCHSCLSVIMCRT